MGTKVIPANVTEIQVRDAIRKILEDKEHYHTSLNWAVNYCSMALNMSGKALRDRCIYILNNLTYWRHKDAKEVRQVLKDFINQTK